MDKKGGLKMSEIYLVRDRKKKCVIGIFDKEHMKPFFSKGFAKPDFDIHIFDANEQYENSGIDIIWRKKK